MFSEVNISGVVLVGVMCGMAVATESVFGRILPVFALMLLALNGIGK